MVDIYRLNHVMGRFDCPGFEEGSETICKYSIPECGHNPGYEWTTGLVCAIAQPENNEWLEMLKNCKFREDYIIKLEGY
jgi:hypothetical protein